MVRGWPTQPTLHFIVVVVVVGGGCGGGGGGGCGGAGGGCGGGVGGGGGCGGGGGGGCGGGVGGGGGGGGQLISQKSPIVYFNRERKLKFSRGWSNLFPGGPSTYSYGIYTICDFSALYTYPR